MPGLLRRVGRTAVVAGTATAVSNRVSRRQAGRWAHQDEQTPTDEGMEKRIAQLKDLADLKQQGIITDAEFEAQKARILG
jgi:hypothetical protein